MAAHKPNLREDYDLIKGAALEEKKQSMIDKWLKEKVTVTNIKINENYQNAPFLKEWGLTD